MGYCVEVIRKFDESEIIRKVNGVLIVRLEDSETLAHNGKVVESRGELETFDEALDVQEELADRYRGERFTFNIYSTDVPDFS